MKPRLAVTLLLLSGIAAASPKVTLRKPFERVASMDPHRAGDVCSATAVSLVYEPLLEVEYRTRPYRLKPLLCDLPEISADGRTYVFRFRDGVRFANGRAVTAADAVWSLKRLADKNQASPGMWVMADVADVVARDARTLAVTLKRKSHVFPWLMAMPYAAVISKEDFGGTGPYRLVTWRKNHEMVYERRDVGKPGVWCAGGTEKCEGNVDEIRYYVIDDVSTQWLMFLGGQLDFLGGISRDNWDAVVGKDGKLLPELVRKGMTLHSAPSLSVFYVGINMNDPVIGGNRKLRQALNAAFDFPAWKRFMNNRVEVSDGPLPPGIAGRLETPFAYRFDVEKAKRLLVEAGYPGGQDPKTGRRLRLEVSVGRATQDSRESIELMAAFYNRVGIELVARYMTWDAFLKTVSDGHTQMFFLGWIGDYPDPENFLQLFHSRNVSPGANHGNYVNPEFDRAFDALDWKTAQEIVREDCPWIFLHAPRTYSLVWNRVKGYRPTDFGYGTEKRLRLETDRKGDR